VSGTLRLRGGERYEVRDDEQSPPKKTPRKAKLCGERMSNGAVRRTPGARSAKGVLSEAWFAPTSGGLYWTRTSDPCDVNTVLYQLS
jgi:hypothetical protein